jgi:peptidyl-prolyl cis-trans isomerase B (cyclophilin B)
MSRFFFPLLLLVQFQVLSQPNTRIRKSDLKKDVLMRTDSGNMVLRLHHSTPLHRDNFIKLVKSHYYDGIGFHRIIAGFMIQAGDEKTKSNVDTNSLMKSYTIPAEFTPALFHKKGVLAAARMGDNVNPKKESSGVQFYIVQGRVHTDQSLDSVETYRLNGRKIPEALREVYKIQGGSPHLDQNYTIFGEMVSGFEVLDKIAGVKTSGKLGGDKPLSTIRIKEAKLIRRRAIE